jgi:hypothetical protein
MTSDNIQLGCKVFTTSIVWCVHTLNVHISSIDDIYRSFHFDADPDPAPYESDANQLRYYWSTGPSRLHFEPPGLH